MKKIQAFLNLIKFEHSIFALPFAYFGFFLGARDAGSLSWTAFGWVTLAMVTLRTAGMCMNRLVDEGIDVKNPRTAERVQLIDTIKRPRLWAIAISMFVLFIISARMLNPICLMLSPIPIALIMIYPFLKRMTWMSHFALGLTLGIAPFGGWLGAGGDWSIVPLMMTVSVASWVAGFDMLYALQDQDFDAREGLHSFPQKFGASVTLLFVRFFHGLTVAGLAAAGWMVHLGFWYWFGIVLVSGFLFWENRLVLQHGLKMVNKAFFNMNAWVSVVIFVALALELVARHGRS